jgi:hypothetical protein
MEETTSLVKIFEESNAELWHYRSHWNDMTITHRGTDRAAEADGLKIAVMIAPPNRTGWRIVDIDAELLTSRTLANVVLSNIQGHLEHLGYRLNNDHTKWRWKYDGEANSFRMNLRALKATPLEEE